MCGIAGVVSSRASRAAVERQLGCLEHRGPDSSGVFDGRGCVLGQTRLAIIDLVRGDPPLTNEDGTICASLNGEVYNYQDLQAALRSTGHVLSSDCDTEVIAHLAETHSPVELARALDGMFAFAVWDERAGRLILGRDRMGKKPLYYFRSPTSFVFGSEIKALLAHPDVTSDPNPNALSSFLTFGYVSSPQTFYEGIVSVPPGSVLVVDRDLRVEIMKYWSPPLPGGNGTVHLDIDEAAAEERVRTLFDAAVRRRLVADVPVGAFLSGGIDSSAVVASMARSMSEPVRTFTIGFDGVDGFDERRYASLIARRFKTDHTEFVVRPDAVDLIERLVWHYDQPFGDSSAIPTFLLSDLTRQHVTVALAGDGGDEIFGGYERFAAAMWMERYRRMPQPLRSSVRSAAAKVPPSAFRNRAASLQRFVGASDAETIDAYKGWVGVASTTVRDDLVRAPSSWAESNYRELWERTRGADLLGRLVHLNLSTYLLDDLLPKVDRMSMAHGLEVRAPFLDTQLVEFALRLPSRSHIRGITLKRLLKRAMTGVLPDEILGRRKKGFGVPLDHWFRGSLRPYVESNLAVAGARVGSFLDAQRVRSLVREHTSGAADHGHLLWSLLTLEVFLRKQDW